MAGQSIDLRPTTLNLLLYSGDGFSIKLLCKDSVGEPIDVNGAISAQIRLNRIDPDIPPLASFTANLVDAYLGIVALSLTGDQTQSLVPDGEVRFAGVWDVQWTPSNKEPRTICQGTVECLADVTR